MRAQEKRTQLLFDTFEMHVLFRNGSQKRYMLRRGGQGLIL